MGIYTTWHLVKLQSFRYCKFVVLSLSFFVLIVGCSSPRNTQPSPHSESLKEPEASPEAPQLKSEAYLSAPNDSLSPPAGVYRATVREYYEPELLTIIHSPPTDGEARYSCVIVSVSKVNTLIDSIEPQVAVNNDIYKLRHSGASSPYGEVKIQQKDENTLLMPRDNAPALSFQRVEDGSLPLANEEAMQIDDERIEECLKGRYSVLRTCPEDDPNSCLITTETTEHILAP